MKIKSTCRECGRGIEFYPSQNRSFCSYSCSSTFKSRAKMPSRPRRGDTLACDVCGSQFYRSPAEIKRDRRFCSSPCHNQHQERGAVVKNCKFCGVEMKHKASQAAVQYCSNRCMGLGTIKRPLDRVHNGKPAKKDRDGYVLLHEPDHPDAKAGGWCYEHRLVAERAIGRRLESHEDVHHVNGVKDDNRPENLEVMTHLDHILLHGKERKKALKRDREELARYRRLFGPLPPKDKPAKTKPPLFF